MAKVHPGVVGGPGITKRGHTAARTKDDLSRMPEGSRVTPTT